MVTTVKQYLCGAAVAGLVAGAGAAVGSQVGLSALTTDWMLAAEHVLLIGTDGTNLDKILEYAYNDGSGFTMLMDRGITAATSIIGHQTMSPTSWSTILTGVWDDKHGVVSNIYRPEPYTAWPSVFNLIEYHQPEVETTIISNWDYLNQLADAGGYPVDNNVFVPFEDSHAYTDELVTALTIAQILESANNPDDVSSFLFSYQSQVDYAGHEFAGGSDEYAQAVINVGANLSQILEAVAQAEAATGDRWTIIAVTDHGHQQTVTLPGFSLGHGFQSPNETSSFVIFSLAGNDDQAGAQSLAYRIVDITPTILQIFGIPMRSDFDGAPMHTDPDLVNSIVFPVDLKQALTAAIDSFDYPNIGTEILLGLRSMAGGAGYFLQDFIFHPIDEYLQSIIDQDIFLVSGLAEGTQWVLRTAGGVVVDVLTEWGRAVGYLTGAGVIAPNDPPLPLPGSAEFTGSWEPALALPDPGAADLPPLLDALAS